MKYYVYEMIDPRTGRAFYIGKGSGRRIQRHFEPRSLKGDSVKNLLIRKFLAAGLNIEIRKIGLFADEQAALDFEAEMICSAPNASLANYNDGFGYRKYEHLRPPHDDYSMELKCY